MKPTEPDCIVNLHIMLRGSDREALREWGKEECRSLNGQILHILRAALAGRGNQGMAELPTDADRVRDATRRAAAEARS